MTTPTATAKTAPTPLKKTPKVKAILMGKPSLTAAQRQALRAKQNAEEFALKKSEIWQSLFFKAMRLALVIQDEHDFVASKSYWFESFEVDAANLEFTTADNGSRRFNEETLQVTDIDWVGEELDAPFAWLIEFKAERARKILELKIQDEKRAAARAKLTAEELKLLGLL
jgi:hypothetical protein